MENELTYYTQFKFCKIFNFFEAMDDVRYLLILDNYHELPEVSEDILIELMEAFEKMSFEYDDSRTSNNEVFNAEKSIKTLSLKKDRINYIIDILRHKYYPDIVIEHEYLEGELKNAGYRLNYSNPQEFHNALDLIAHSSKSIDGRIKEKQEEIKDISENNKFNYIDSVLAIQETTGIKLDVYNDTMPCFISAKKRHEQRVKILNERNNKKAA